MKKLLTVLGISLIVFANACTDKGDTGNQTAAQGNEAVAGGNKQQQAAAPVVWGDAPDVQFMAFDGSQHRISEYGGKPLVLNFWAAWCPPCVKELPEFQDAYAASSGAFELIALAVDNRSDPQVFFSARGFTFNGGFAGPGFQQYVKQSIPVTVFIDAQGNVAARIEGQMTGEKFREMTAKLFGGHSPEVNGSDH